MESEPSPRLSGPQRLDELRPSLGWCGGTDQEAGPRPPSPSWLDSSLRLHHGIVRYADKSIRVTERLMWGLDSRSKYGEYTTRYTTSAEYPSIAAYNPNPA